MRDARIEKLANNLLSHSINLQKGEKVLIEIIGMDAIPLGKELIKQAEKILYSTCTFWRKSQEHKMVYFEISKCINGANEQYEYGNI